MKSFAQLRRWMESVQIDKDGIGWVVSLMSHLALFVTLALVWQQLPAARGPVMLSSPDHFAEDASVQDFDYTPTDVEDAGAGGGGGTGATVASAPTLSEISTVGTRELPASVADIPTIDLPAMAELSAAPNLNDRLTIKGDAGAGATGAEGAVDRITQAIMLSLEQRPTLVVWLLDQSESLRPQRATIERRTDRVYEELGVIQSKGSDAFAKHGQKPLLTAVVAFGKEVTFRMKEPTDDPGEIKKAIRDIENDPDGIEMTFTAVSEAARRYKKLRTASPRRNVMLIVVTDESGNDEGQLETALDLCRRSQMPVYVIGVPAPFGQRQAFVKYVDPDPKYDQSVQNIPVDQGPESAKPESVQLGFSAGDWDRYTAIDSGFGPYALTRLCYETGGAYFAVHPNRPTTAGHVKDTAVMATRISEFFDPAIMRTYQPDYVSPRGYDQLLKENKARAALVQAAEMSLVEPMDKPRLQFPKRNDADLKRELDLAARSAAVVQPKLDQLYGVLKAGEKDRPKLTSPRWQAGYDLAMGRTMAILVRTVCYNAMLAKAKNGMKFEKADSDTWALRPADEITVDSKLEKLAAQAREYLERVRDQHPGTPWAYLAQRELSEPLGWQWTERHIGINDPPRMARGGGGGGNPRDTLQKLEKPKPVRANVKL
ncbi:MAG: VWA domain-containing protein [Planctomycetia bacterium]|nr:VWA domain-containing protein [Planctomycetia bacterium]